MREIGSEFWRNCTPDGGNGIKPAYTKDFCTIETLSGRTALDIIICDILKVSDVRTAYLPSYCCHSIIEPFVSNGLDVEFYGVIYTSDGLKINVDVNNGCNIILLIDYFGHIDADLSRWAHILKKGNNILVYDATHSLLCDVDVSCYDYVFASYRKWINANAGFCAKKEPFLIEPVLSYNYDYVNMRDRAFENKGQYISGLGIDKNSFLQDFADAESMLDDMYRGFTPDIKSDCIISTADKHIVIDRRRRNADLLIEWLVKHDELCDMIINGFVSNVDVPLFVPISVKDHMRDDLRCFFIEHDVYCPVHWPLSIYHEGIVGAERELYENELSLICDQRYDDSDMKRVIEVMNMFLYR